MNYTKINKYIESFGNLKLNPEIHSEENNSEKKIGTEQHKLFIRNGIVICPDCICPTVTHGLNIWECSQCGSLVDNLIDQTAEWRMYQDGIKSDTVRCSTVINDLLPQSSKGTIILSKSNSNYNMRRTQKVHSWSAMTYKERCLNDIFQDISLRSNNVKTICLNKKKEKLIFKSKYLVGCDGGNSFTKEQYKSSGIPVLTKGDVKPFGRVRFNGRKYIDSEDRLKSDRNFCFKEDHEIVSDFKNLPDALENTVMIAKKCSFFLEEKNPKLPKINV